jgi:8-oxo-dGTP diphosphatase
LVNHTRNPENVSVAPESASPEPAPPGYRAGDYPPFAVTVDIVVLTLVERALHVLLIQRGAPPYEGRWALPGGFVRPDESLDEAAARELQEETGVDAAAHLEQFGSYGDPDRDPRMRVVSIGYLAVLREVGAHQAGSDAADTALAPVADVLGGGAYDLAFDHRRILDDGVNVMREKLERTSLATAFVGPEFTLADLRSVYESAWGQPIDPANFRRKMLSTEGVIRSTGTVRTPSTEGGKPAELFTAPDEVRELDVRFRAPVPPAAPAAAFAAFAADLDGIEIAGDTRGFAVRAERRAARAMRRARVASPDVDAIVRALTEGPAMRLRDVKRGTGGPAGIFLLWYRDRPLFLGRARKAASESKPSNRGQADGVRGRLRGIRRQPTASIVQALEEHFPDDAAFGTAAALTNHGTCRYVELASGEIVDEVFPDVVAALAVAGIVPLAQPDR